MMVQIATYMQIYILQIDQSEIQLFTQLFLHRFLQYVLLLTQIEQRDYVNKICKAAVKDRGTMANITILHASEYPLSLST